MAGIDKHTGKMLDGWANVSQKLVTLYTTRIGSRFMRRTVGANVPALLGQNITAATILRFKTAIIVATELWEPRFKISVIGSEPLDNTPETLRSGNLELEILGEFRPRAHLGDDTTDTMERRLVIGRSTNGNMEAL